MGGFLARLLVTYAYICFSISSSAPPGTPSAAHGMLPYRLRPPAQARGFGGMLHARLLSMPGHSTSELLRTL